VIPPNIAPHVSRLLAEHIDSVEQLEILLLLRGAPERAWSATEVADALYTHPDSAGRRLDALGTSGLLARNAGDERRWCYRPRTEKLDAAVSDLAATYAERRVAVITLIASRPMDNVRAFSEAFRLRKKGD
jgi:DNA-binding MarR family transcriptional regulator